MSLDNHIAKIVDATSLKINEKGRLDIGDLPDLEALNSSSTDNISAETNAMLWDLKRSMSNMIFRNGLTLEWANTQEQIKFLKNILKITSINSWAPVTYEQIDPNNNLTHALDALKSKNRQHISLIYSNGKDHEANNNFKQGWDKSITLYEQGNLVAVINNKGVYLRYDTQNTLFDISTKDLKQQNYSQGSFYQIDENGKARWYNEYLGKNEWFAWFDSTDSTPKKLTDLNHQTNNNLPNSLANATENLSKLNEAKSRLEDIYERAIVLNPLAWWILISNTEIENIQTLFSTPINNTQTILNLVGEMDQVSQNLNTKVETFITITLPDQVQNNLTSLIPISFDQNYRDNLNTLKNLYTHINELVSPYNILFETQKDSIDTAVLRLRKLVTIQLNLDIPTLSTDLSSLETLTSSQKIVDLFDQDDWVFATLDQNDSLSILIQDRTLEIKQSLARKKVENTLTNTVTHFSPEEVLYLDGAKIATLNELILFLEDHETLSVDWDELDENEAILLNWKSIFHKLSVITDLELFLDQQTESISQFQTEIKQKLEKITDIKAYLQGKIDFIQSVKQSGNIDSTEVNTLKNLIKWHTDIQTDFSDTLREIIIVNIWYNTRNYSALLDINSSGIVLKQSNPDTQRVLVEKDILDIIWSDFEAELLQNYKDGNDIWYQVHDVQTSYINSLENLWVQWLKNSELIDMSDDLALTTFKNLNTSTHWHETNLTYNQSQKQEILQILYPYEHAYIKALNNMFTLTDGSQRFSTSQQESLINLITEDIKPLSIHSNEALQTYIEKELAEKLSDMDFNTLQDMKDIIQILSSPTELVDKVDEEIYRKEILKDLWDRWLQFIPEKNINDFFDTLKTKDMVTIFTQDIITNIWTNSSTLEKIHIIQKTMEGHEKLSNKFFIQAMLELFFNQDEIKQGHSIPNQVKNHTVEYQSKKQAEFIQQLIDKENGEEVDIATIIIRRGGTIGNIRWEIFTSLIKDDNISLENNELGIQLWLTHHKRNIEIVYNNKKLIIENDIVRAREIIALLISHNYGEISNDKIPKELR